MSDPCQHNLQTEPDEQWKQAFLILGGRVDGIPHLLDLSACRDGECRPDKEVENKQESHFGRGTKRSVRPCDTSCSR